MSFTVKYPLSSVEMKLVAWTGSVITLLAIAAIALLGTIALASS